MNTHERYHAFDSLRAAMMLLGVFIHTACAYASLRDTWWYYDQAQSFFYDAGIVFIHIFRMPVFFVMAGFFGALLYGRRGNPGFLKNRALRLLLPLALGMLVLFPPMRFLDAFSWAVRQPKPDPLGEAVQFLATGRFLERIFPMHLWFLQYLVYLTALAAVAVPAVESRWCHRPRQICGAWFRRALLSKQRALLFAAPTLLSLLCMKHGILDTPQDWGIHWNVLLAYAVFYLFGWTLFAHRDLLPELTRGGWSSLLLALAVSGIAIRFAAGQLTLLPNLNRTLVTATALANAVSCWLFIFAFIGLFLRYLNRPSPAMRYLSDSAYWVYLIHPPVLVVVQLAIREMAWPAHLKAAFVLAVATPVLLLSYHFCVRQTWVGVLLNGRRHPASPQATLLPAAAPAAG